MTSKYIIIGHHQPAKFLQLGKKQKKTFASSFFRFVLTPDFRNMFLVLNRLFEHSGFCNHWFSKMHHISTIPHNDFNHHWGYRWLIFLMLLTHVYKPQLKVDGKQYFIFAWLFYISLCRLSRFDFCFQFQHLVHWNCQHFTKIHDGALLGFFCVPTLWYGNHSYYI